MRTKKWLMIVILKNDSVIVGLMLVSNSLNPYWRIKIVCFILINVDDSLSHLFPSLLFLQFWCILLCDINSMELFSSLNPLSLFLSLKRSKSNVCIPSSIIELTITSAWVFHLSYRWFIHLSLWINPHFAKDFTCNAMLLSRTTSNPSHC